MNISVCLTVCVHCVMAFCLVHYVSVSSHENVLTVGHCVTVSIGNVGVYIMFSQTSYKDLDGFNTNFTSMRTFYLDKRELQQNKFSLCTDICD